MSLSEIKSIITYRQFTEPVSPAVGQTWLNTRTEKVKTWNGSEWSINWSGYGGYGYTIGGANAGSTIGRILFPFDSGIAQDVGTLVSSATISNGGGGVNSSNYAYTQVNSTSTALQRFQFPFDSGTASDVGNLNHTADGPHAFNSSLHGFITGGQTGSYAYTSNMDRITFPHDSGTGSANGVLSSSRRSGCGVNSSTHGYAIAGSNSASSQHNGTTTIDRLQFPNDSGGASHVANIGGTHVLMCGGFNSSSYGYVISGWHRAPSTYYYTYISRFQFPFDSGTSSVVGNSTQQGYRSSSVNSTNYGYTLGGYNGSVGLSSVLRVQFPFDSGTDIAIGNLAGTRYSNRGVDETDFVSMFV